MSTLLRIRGALKQSQAIWRLNSIRCCSKEAAESGVPYTKYDAGAADGQGAPPSADCVIIGGGVIGCATLYWLTKLGMNNVVLCEKDQLTAGTTWHTAGLVWNLRPDDTEVKLLNNSVKLMTSIEEETGVDPGWINNGGLFVATNKERLDEYKRMYTLSKAMNIESHILGPEDTKKLYPLMNVDDVVGSLYSPRDGTIDPAGYCSALSRAGTNQGGVLLQNCPVTGIEVEKNDFGTKEVVAVNTVRGTIKTKCVVNAAGVWAPYFGQMAGVKVPLVAMKHAYVVTERIEGIQNMPNARDHDASVYLKLQGDALSVGGYEQNPVFWDEVQKDFAFGLFDLDWDVFSSNIMGAIHRVPAVETSGVKSTVCGPESFTPDHKPLMGESPEVRGYYLNCGYNSGGMMASGGYCEQMAKWILHGSPEFDMYGYDIRRFTTKLTNNTTWIRERSHESYAKNYSTRFPHDEPLACRNMRQDALFQTLLDEGCHYQERTGWERPGWFVTDDVSPAVMNYDYYGSYDIPVNENNVYKDKLELDYTFDFPKHHDILGAECLACRNNVAVFNMSYFGKYYLVGPDAQKAADWIFSNDMTKPTGSTVYTCMLNAQGGIQADLTVSMLNGGAGNPHDPQFEGPGFYIAMGGGNEQFAHSHIRNILQDHKWDVQLIDHSDDMAMLSVQGPKSRALLEELTGETLDNENFPFSTHKVVSVAGHGCRALRLSFVGELGWELHVPNASAVPVYKALMEAGKKHGIANAGYRAIDSLSIEKGYRHWHADIRPDDTPLEGGLAFTCKLKTDTPFLGRKAIEKQKKGGIKKKLVCMTIDAHVPLQGLETVFRDGVAVGYLRRADYAFALDKSIGYGYITRPDGETIKNDFLKSGEYVIEHLGEQYPAKVHISTPFDPKNLRVKGFYDEAAAS